MTAQPAAGRILARDRNGGAPRFLVIGPSWIGDMVMAQSLFITLKQRHPDCLVDVVAPAWSLPVLQRMPEVDQGIDVGIGHGKLALRHRRRLGRRLAQAAYDQAFVIPRSWKAALIPFFAGVPVRTGYRGEMRYGLLNDIRKLDRQRLRQTVQRYVALAADAVADAPPPVPHPALRVDDCNQQALCRRFGLSPDEKVLCMMPGAEYGPAKQWPVRYFSALAGALLAEGWQVWILGSTKDVGTGRAIQEKLSGTTSTLHNLCGQTELVDTIDLLAMARAVVSNDSGLMHVAAAVGSHVYVIYGSSTPDYTPPLTTPERADVFYLNLECSPCFERVCPLGHTDCLEKITDERVYERIVKQH